MQQGANKAKLPAKNEAVKEMPKKRLVDIRLNLKY